MYTKRFYYHIAQCIQMLSHVLAFHVDEEYIKKENDREDFIKDYFKMAQSYMEMAKDNYKEVE